MCIYIGVGERIGERCLECAAANSVVGDDDDDDGGGDYAAVVRVSVES